MELAHISVTIK